MARFVLALIACAYRARDRPAHGAALETRHAASGPRLSAASGTWPARDSVSDHDPLLLKVIRIYLRNTHRPRRDTNLELDHQLSQFAAINEHDSLD